MAKLLLFFLSFSGASDTVPLFVSQMIRFYKGKCRLVLHDTELADPIPFPDRGITHGIGREKPLVVITAVTLIDDSHMVGLDDPKIFEGAASGNDMGLRPRRNLHGNT